MYLYLSTDLDYLKSQLAVYEVRLQEALSGIHDSTTQSSETWHDNPAFDEQQLQAKMWNQERTKLAHIVLNAQLIEPACSTEKVAIGTVVSVLNLKSGNMEQYEIASFTAYGDSIRISYASPMGAALLNSAIGDMVNLNINSKVTELKVILIELAVTAH